MKYLIGLVCPDNLFNNNLLPKPKKLLTWTMKAFGSYVQDPSVVILRSPADGAMGSSKLARMLYNLPESAVVQRQELWETQDVERAKKVVSLVKEYWESHDTAIVISHPNLTTAISRLLAQEVGLEAGIKDEGYAMKTGDGWIMDLENQVMIRY